MDAERTSTRRFLSRSPEATEALGEALGRAVGPGTVIALEGDLGAGKTCFVRGLARGLGVEGTVTSPTFALLQDYAGRLPLHHFDAYMEGRERAFLADGGLEHMHEGGVSAVEWAPRVADVLPTPRLWVALEHRGASERSIALGVEGGGEAARALARLVADLEAQPGLEEDPG
jgi:tRNA threonylcarbamoyladenosine biosynthesis protein TsaE